MKVNMKKKLVIALVIIAMILPQLSSVLAAIEWNTDSGSKVYLGVEFRQPNGKYYTISSNGDRTRAIYRTYLGTSNGSEQDFSKNIFCLDMNGLFPTEQSTATTTTNGKTAQYTSKGEVTTSTTIPLSSNTNKTLSTQQVSQILAIMNEGYDYESFQDEANVKSWLINAASGWDNSDDGVDAIADYIDADEIFILQQVAIWKITNGLDPTLLSMSQSSTGPFNPPTSEQHRLAQTIILSYFEDIANNYQDHLPTTAETPSFISKGQNKTTNRINGYVYVGPFQIENSDSMKSYEVYTVKTVDGKEVETKVSNYKVYNGNEYSSTSYGSIKSAGENPFYIRISNTEAATAEKIRIKIKSVTNKITLWQNENSNEAQPLISLGEEEKEDIDESPIEKPKYDVALRKYITKINGEDIENSRQPVVTDQTDGFNSGDFKYSHIKEPVKVKIGDEITYEIQVFNECENDVVITGIKDYLPNGLEITGTTWTEGADESGNRFAFLAENMPLDALTVDGTGKHTTSIVKEITCRVTGDVKSGDILTNVAEITGLTDKNGTTVTDEDSKEENLSDETRSCPDDYIGESGKDDLNDPNHYYYGEEDDDDFEKLIVEVEGAYNIKLIKADSNGETIKSDEAEFKIGDETKTTTNGELQVAENIQITNTDTDDVYVIEETKAPDGYNKYNGKITVTVKKEQADGEYKVKEVILTDEEGNVIPSENVQYSIDGNLIILTIKNELLEGNYNLNLEKIDTSGNIITDGEAIFKINDGESKSTSNGKLSIAQNVEISDISTPDEYTIVEESAPEGYEKSDRTIKVIVNKEEADGSYQIKDVTVTEIDSSGNEVSTVTVKRGEGAKSTDNIIVDLTNGIITLKVKNNKVTEIDLALRKYIQTINGTQVDPTRDPNSDPNSIDTSKLDDGSQTTAEYNHPKNVLDVNKGDIIVYTIKVYNEADTDAFAKEVTDYIPEGLGYLMYHQINVSNGWQIDNTENYNVIKYNELPQELIDKIGNKLTPSDFRTVDDPDVPETSMDNVHILLGKAKIKTEALKDEKIPAYNPDATLEADRLSYKTLQVACVVLDPETYESANITTSLADGQILKNIAAVTLYGDKDGNDVTNDRDSDSSEINPDAYPDDNIQDDDDYDVVRYNDKTFDLALKKFITTVKTPKGDGTFEEVQYANNRMISANGDSLQNSQDATYEMDKTPVKVKTGDTVVYTIRIYNEGETDGYASRIYDTLPEGLEFVQYTVDDNGNFIGGSEINYKYGWNIFIDSDTDSAAWKSGLQTDYLKDKLIPAYDKTTGKLSYEEVQIELRVVSTEPKEITNIAEIAEDSGEDRDSNVNNLDEEEDDQDYDVIIPQEFDLALQKFITGVDGKVVTDRKPTLTLSDGEIEYTHTTEPYVVANGNKVTYTIRIYNEGDIAGFPSIVKDDLPDGITFLPESEVNKKYEWKMYRKVKEDEDKTNLTIVKFDEKEYVEVEKVEEAEIIATDYYSYEKATKRGESAIKAYDKEVGLTDTNPDFRDLQVEFEVTETAVDGANRVIINTAEISNDEDEDGNEVEDKDSTPDNDKEEEDDIDKEYIQLKYFDLSLLKYVSEVEVTEDGKKKVTETGYDGTENPEPIVKVEIHRNKLKTTKVRYTYTIKITNEGEIEGYATEITDYIPEGLEFYEEDNEEYNWKTGEDGKIKTDYLKDKLLKPGESAEVKLVLRWKNSSNNLGQKINTAEISDDENEYNAPDIDSTPDNKKDGEDDIDDAIVILSIKTGGTQLYIILTITIITILTAGGFIIYKYVYKPQEATILVDNNKYRRRK